MTLPTREFASAWQAIAGRKTDFDDGWKLVQDGEDVFLATRPYPERASPFGASLSVDEESLVVVVDGAQTSVPIAAVRALLSATNSPERERAGKGDAP